MFRKLVQSSVVLLLVSVKLSVNGLVNDGELAEKSEILVSAPVNGTAALSGRAGDVKDTAVKNIADASSIEISGDAKINNPVMSDKPPMKNQDSTVSRESSLGEKKSDEIPSQQSAAKNETAGNNTTIHESKIHDKDGDTENPSAAENEETTLPSSEAITPETTKNTTEVSSTTPSNTTSELVSESTLKSSTTSTTETTVTNNTEVTVTLPVESSSDEKTTQEPKVEPTEAKDPGMSSGIIALVMAIVFAVVVVIVYIALLLWRRYLEYRYGNRELLVNDLEFDTNDLRHFEL